MIQVFWLDANPSIEMQMLALWISTSEEINTRRCEFDVILKKKKKKRQEQNEYVDSGRRFKMACAQANQSQPANLIVLGLSSNVKYNLCQHLSYSTYTRDLWLWLEMGSGLKMKSPWVLHTHNYH